MLPELMIEVIEDVNSPKEFNEVLHNINQSYAKDDIKEEAKEMLFTKKSQFDTTPKYTPKEVQEDIEAGKADIDDIG